MAKTRTKKSAAATVATTTQHVLIRDIDTQLWRRAKGKAAVQGLTLRAAIVGLLQDWVRQS